MLTPEENMDAQKHKDTVSELKAEEVLSISPDCYGAAIHVSEKRPESGQAIFFYAPQHKAWHEGWYDDYNNMDRVGDFYWGTTQNPLSGITHWMPKPPAPRLRDVKLYSMRHQFEELFMCSAKSLLTPDEYIGFCDRLIATANKYGHPHHEFESVLDELIALVEERARTGPGH